MKFTEPETLSQPQPLDLLRSLWQERVERKVVNEKSTDEGQEMQLLFQGERSQNFCTEPLAQHLEKCNLLFLKRWKSMRT